MLKADPSGAAEQPFLGNLSPSLFQSVIPDHACAGAEGDAPPAENGKRASIAWTTVDGLHGLVRLGTP